MKNQISLLVLICTGLLFLSTPVIGAVREYNLTIKQQQITILGKTANGMTINDSIPGPTLRFTEGDTARIYVKNEMSVPTSIHWHGLLVPSTMDGVPFVTQVPIKPGTTFTYEFPIRQTGTYWYHSHTDLQEQRGLYGSIVIDDRKHKTDRDYVVLLSDWTTESPNEVIRTLKRGSEWYALEKGSSQSIIGAAKAGKLGDYFKRELQRMPPMDIADVAYEYFLSNGKPETMLEAKGHETVRLRVINGSATTYFHLNFSGGPMTIVSADGQLVQPIKKDLFLIGVAETYDVIITIPETGSYEFRATAHDGSGFTSTWLGTGQGHPARTIPKPNLYEPMGHSGMGSMFALTPAGSMGMPDSMVNSGALDNPGMSHEVHETPHDSAMEMMGHSPALDIHKSMPDMMSPELDTQMKPVMNESAISNKKDPETSLNHQGMANDMHMEKSKESIMHGSKSSMNPSQEKPKSFQHQSMTTKDQDHVDDSMDKINLDSDREVMDSAIPVASGRSFGSRFGLLEADISSRQLLASEGGPDRPTTPYAQLKSAKPTSLPADASTRIVRLTLDGDMERYTWFLNNKPIAETDSIRIREGEIVRFIMINRTMMHHPMHLHGHFFRVLNGNGENAPLKHTVDIAPMSTTVIEFYGNEVGDWFFHCHLLYHMKSGMSRLVHYEDFQPDSDVANVRSLLYKDPFYFYGTADVSSNLTEGNLSLAGSRMSFDARWEVGWQQVDETDWEGIVTSDYYFNRFSSLFAGLNIMGEGSSNDETRGVLGFRYLLPLNLESAFWLDTDGGGRLFLEKELQFTPRIGMAIEAECDTHTQWEGKVELSYLIAKNFSLITNWHSEYGIGAGLRVRF